MREPDKHSVVVELGVVMSLNRRAAVRALCGGALWMAALRRTASSRSWAAERRIQPGASSALIVVDVQNCFVKGGTLAVAHGEDVVPVINRLAPAFQNIILTQDWHSPGHTSFASSHPGKQPFDSVHLSYGNQVLWPDHCVQGTPDAALDADLRVPQAQLVLRKGYHKDIDSYSAFMEADHRTPTGLQAYLEQRGIERLFVTGLATDFCVAWTALDARTDGFDTYVIEDACRGIDLHGSLAAAWKEMQSHGVKRIQSADIEAA
jgi:nicotinamidase/pyrazinamidase